jgi:HK97 family phage portal protein
VSRPGPWRLAWSAIKAGLAGKSYDDFYGLAPGRQDGDNFRRNLVTLAEYDDLQLSGRSAAIGLAATWACYRLIAETNAQAPAGVFRTAADGTREAARDHPLYGLLHDSPNADQTAFDFWDFVNSAIELAGNAFAVKEKGTLDRIRALTLIRPDTMTVRRAGNGSLIYAWSEGSQRREEPQENILHIRGPGGNALGGVSTLAMCRGVFGAALGAERASSAILRNGVRPSGTLSTDVKFQTAEQRQEAEQLIAEKFVGAMNAGRPMLLDGGLKWEQLTIDPVDAQLLESRKFSGEEICRLFRVPPAMVGFGDKSSNWGTGKEVDVLGFVKFALLPRLTRIEQALMKQLLTPRDRADGIIIEFNLEGLLRGDSDGRAQFYERMTRIGAMTINEVRRLENMPPVEGGDVPRMQMQNVPITEANGLNAPPKQGA